MKRIMQLLFCMMLVIGLSAIEAGVTNAQEAPSDDQPKGFREDINLSLLQSIFYSIYDKKTKRDMLLSLAGEKLV